MSDRKRALSSPLLNLENKRPSIMESSISDSPTSVAEGPASDSLTNYVNLSPDDIKLIAAELHALFLPVITTMVEQSVATATQHANVIVAELQAENKVLKSENTLLTGRIAALEKASDEAEQYSRRNCLRISGVPESTDEDTDRVILNVAKAIKADITKADIDRSHRVGKPGVSPRRIIVKFSTYRARQLFLQNRKQLKTTANYKNTYINEDLTQARNMLMFKARQCVRNGSLTGAWTLDGNIFVRDSSGKKHRVYRESDIDTLAAATVS